MSEGRGGPRRATWATLTGFIVILLGGAGSVVVAHSAEGPAAALSVGIPIVPAPPRSILQANEFVDHSSLQAALLAQGVPLRSGTSVYAARVRDEPGGLRYDEFDAGGGALAGNFWPASSVKVLAAVGALDFLADLGFTGAARVTMPGYSGTVRDLYQIALRDSSNEAYDRLLQIAGVDWLNTEFLTPQNGFVKTVIQRAYTGTGGVPSSPPMTVTEGLRTQQLPARVAKGTTECPNQGNCSNLLELTESIRRVVLSDDIPPAERFNIAEADLQGIRDALLAAQGFIERGVIAALGHGVLIYNKPGFAPGDECVDVAVIDDLTDSEQFLVAVSTPAGDSTCSELIELTRHTLNFLRR